MDEQHQITPDDLRTAQPVLFGEPGDFAPSSAAREAPTTPAGKPRLQRADRAQAEFRSVLLDEWLLATIEGVGSGRRLDKLCTEHLAYLWLLGGVTVNYHTLSDFRVGQGDFLDKVLTDSLASLLAKGLLTLNRTAQYGMRVRASAGTSSFRSRQRWQQFQDEARDQVCALKEELPKD